MVTDVFGDLQEWGRVMELLDRLAEQRLVDEHQPGLARLVRYRDNWRLREKALQCAMLVSQASDLLIAEVLNLLVDPEAELSLRVLCAQALGHLVPLRMPQAGSHFDIDKVTRTMADMLAHPEPPVLHDAVKAALVQVQR
ncbi:MAG: hypothetical protein JW797_02350 [Bradymonadales bacterium]|nr:hypothetical protein [Bradymonadales bacterium]